MHKTVVMSAMPVVSVGDVQMEVAADEQPALWQYVVPLLYITGVVVVLSRTLLSVWRVLMLVRRSERIPQADGTTLCVVKDDVPPFSFCSYIVMNHSDYEANDAAVLAHERGHIRQHHSCDVLLVDILTALQWFNPAMWMLRADLRAIHEYEADGAVLSQGINARQYQYLLITKAASIGGYSIANGISHSTLKNRITMMLQKKSPRSRFMKLLALVPIVGIALALNAETVNDYVYQQPQKKVVKKGSKSATTKMGNNTIEIVPSQDAAEQADPAKVVEWVVAKEPDKKPIVLLEGHRITYETFTRMDPDEIASITVLKDQPAVDQYGEEARNGVILITTKKGVEVFTPVEQNPEYFDVVEQMPEFPGGAQALFGFVAKNIHYPKAAEDAGIQGRVIVTFVVMKDGSIGEVKVAKGVSPELDGEAVRCVKSMPKWKPGMQKGQAVNVKFTMPISFALPDSKVEETKESSVVVVGMK
jgi:TonB family protein